MSEARKTPVTQSPNQASNSQFIPIHHPGAFPPLPSRPGKKYAAFSELSIAFNFVLKCNYKNTEIQNTKEYKILKMFETFQLQRFKQ